MISVPTFRIIAKQNKIHKFEVRIGLAEGIIDNTHVLSILSLWPFDGSWFFHMFLWLFIVQGLDILVV